MKKTVEQRFWEKVGSHDDPIKCWLWVGAISRSSHGGAKYGSFRVGDKMVSAHRLSYEMHHHVTIPEGMTIDHVKIRGCTSTLCVNPNHLEVVTSRVNTLRGDTLQSLNAHKTCCVHGHVFNEENTYVYPSGYRACRACVRKSRQKYQTKKQKGVISCLV